MRFRCLTLCILFRRSACRHLVLCFLVRVFYCSHLCMWCLSQIFHSRHRSTNRVAAPSFVLVMLFAFLMLLCLFQMISSVQICAGVRCFYACHCCACFRSFHMIGYRSNTNTILAFQMMSWGHCFQVCSTSWDLLWTSVRSRTSTSSTSRRPARLDRSRRWRGSAARATAMTLSVWRTSSRFVHTPTFTW